MNTRDWLQIGELAVGALETIQKITKVGGAPAEAILGAVSAVLEYLEDGMSGKVTPQTAQLQIEQLHRHIENNDADAIAALKRKFATP